MGRLRLSLRASVQVNVRVIVPSCSCNYLHRCGVVRGRARALQTLFSKLQNSGGEGGIRTPGGLAPPTVFKTVAIDHSATSPQSLRPNNRRQLFRQAKTPPDDFSPKRGL